MAQYTKKAILLSFVNLLSQNSLDKITVKDIVEDCGINRNTFYYYFRDIYDLLDELFRSETEQAIGNGQIFTSWQEGFQQAMHFALENKKAVYHVYNSVGREPLERYLHDVVYKMMLNFVQQEAKGLEVLEEDMTFIASFYQHAFVGMLLDWLRHDMEDDPHMIIWQIENLFRGSVRFVLQNSRHQKNNIKKID